MKVDLKTPDCFAARVPIRINQCKQLFGLGSSKKRGIKQFCDPIHFVRIREIECDLNIFIGIFNENDAVAVDVGTLPFAFKENGAAFLHLGRSQVRLLEKETTFSNVSGFKLAAASCCLVGAVRRVLLTKKAMIVSQVFMYLRERIWAARVHGSGTTCLAGHGFFHLTPGISRRGHWKRRPPFSFTAQFCANTARRIIPSALNCSSE